jgi:hypothetical protein
MIRFVHAGSVRHAIFKLSAAHALWRETGKQIRWSHSPSPHLHWMWQKCWPGFARLLERQPYIAEIDSAQAEEWPPMAQITGDMPCLYLKSVGMSLLWATRPWLYLPAHPPTVAQFCMSYRPRFNGSWHLEFDWQGAVAAAKAQGLLFVGPLDRARDLARIIGTPVDCDICSSVDVSCLADLIAGTRGYFGSPGIPHALARALGRPALLIADKSSCEHRQQSTLDVSEFERWLSTAGGCAMCAVPLDLSSR